MLQYFSVTGNTVFMCLSFVLPGQHGPIPMLMYGFLITDKQRSIHRLGHIHTHTQHISGFIMILIYFGILYKSGTSIKNV